MGKKKPHILTDEFTGSLLELSSRYFKDLDQDSDGQVSAMELRSSVLEHLSKLRATRKGLFARAFGASSRKGKLTTKNIFPSSVIRESIGHLDQ